jgi:hypothetical protein
MMLLVHAFVVPSKLKLNQFFTEQQYFYNLNILRIAGANSFLAGGMVCISQTL